MATNITKPNAVQRPPVWLIAHRATLAQKSASRPAVQEHNDFPVSFADFSTALKGTDDEIWTKLLKNKFGAQKKHFPAWRAALAAVKAGK